ncbi:Bug family tripartite tricarboxylate transporter substrate binding protein [Rhodovarius sp.]|uniref:Bug family tripartite tricarboxylate transporter substrate binding protein n=1 Tax=Rhodovarius sp. TaxID=2972673 RepID=UPI0034A41C16
MTVRIARRAALLCLASPALAQEAWPARGVTIVVPFAPGSSSDIIGRSLAQHMQQALDKPFAVENRPGASGIIGTQQVVRSAPDGHTLMHAPLSVWAINVALRPNLPYDPTRDLTRIMQTVRTPNVLVVNPAVAPVANLAEFIAWLKRPGNNGAYSSSGIGSSDHTTGALFSQVTGTDSTHVPFTGGGPATAALLAGNVPFSFQNLGSIMPQIRDGRVRALLVTSEARHPLLPEVPHATEAGLPELVVYSWQALGGPPGMAAPLVTRVHEAATAALRAPTTLARLEDLGFEVVASQPEVFARFQAQEIARWQRVVRQGNIRPE